MKKHHKSKSGHHTEASTTVDALQKKIKQLDAENFQLKNIIDNLPGDIYWKTLDGVWSGVNLRGSKSLKKMGFIEKKEDVLGKTDFELFDKETAEAYRRNDLEVIKAQREITREEINNLPNGEKIIQLSAKRPLWDKHGTMVGIVGNTIDITHLKKIEYELNIAKEKAEAANQAKTEFLENMRHDIRTPLSGIVGFAELIKSEATNPQVKEYADNLVASSHALLDLMDEVLEAIRVSSGDIPKMKKKFSLKKTIENVIQLNQSKAASKRLELRLDYQDSLPQYVLGDNVRIHRIALELVANALNFTDNGTVLLSLTCARETEQKVILKLVVKDTGIGIPPEKRQEIFLQFKRLTPSYQGIYKGAGLGLAVIKQFVDDLEGEIYVESTPRQGSTFTCLLPLQKPLLDDDTGVEDELDVRFVTPFKAINTQSKPDNLLTKTDAKTAHRILLVEDNIIAQNVAKHLLASFDCKTDIATTGQEALALWNTQTYDLIFMDIGLPDIDGYQVTHHIRSLEAKRKHHTPIVALTAHVGDENKQRCIEAGMNAVLTKPLTHKSTEDMLTSFIAYSQKKSQEPSQIYANELPEQDEQLFELDVFPIFDKEEGLKTLVQESMLNELLNMTVNDSLPKDRALMVDAHDKKDWESAQKIAHKIKGGAVYIGTKRLKIACQYFERYWKQNQELHLEALYQQALTVIDDTLETLKTYLAMNHP